MTAIPVKKIMVSDLITADSNDSVFVVYQILKKCKIHHVPIINQKGDIQGIISWTDIERLRVGASLFRNPKNEEYTEAFFHSMRACDIMGEKLTTIEASDSILTAYGIFKKNEFHALPVVENGKLIGIVTPLDILDYFFNIEQT